MVATLEYLTVQDIIWLNTQICGGPQPFRYDALEEASFLQYGYGSSSDLLLQASKLGKRFAGHKAFDRANEATAFAALAAFLLLNGRALTAADADAASWFRNTALDSETLTAATTHHDRHGSHQQMLAEVLLAYPQTISQLRD